MRTCKQIIVGVTLLASLSGFGLTEVVDGITWTYTVENGCASVGDWSSSSTAVPTTTMVALRWDTPSLSDDNSVKYGRLSCDEHRVFCVLGL